MTPTMNVPSADRAHRAGIGMGMRIGGAVMTTVAR
jgi:hypothetical protein